MISISKRYNFDSAHRLHRDDWHKDKNKFNFGKCNRLHGHTYGLVVEVTGPVLDETGMILNYFDLDKVMKPLVDSLDHRFLNDVFPNMLTTSENMVGRLAHLIKLVLQEEGYDITLHRVTLSETPRTTATWQN